MTPAETRPFQGIGMRPGVDLVAVGGQLDPDLVMHAYRNGVFPWYDAGDPVLWWSPDPRGILPLDGFHVSRRLARTLRTGSFDIAFDRSFEDVMRGCDENRADGSWIHADVVRCYTAMHANGDAHSVEVHKAGDLVGGLYGVAFGGGFAAESMFHRVRDASKVALAALVEHLRARGFVLLDVQFVTPHLEQFGCVKIPREEYLDRVKAAVAMDVRW
jgi:leucyl/phenylalanyl-tRNA--protein transferase